jgi:hypothetical protein
MHVNTDKRIALHAINVPRTKFCIECTFASGRMMSALERGQRCRTSAPFLSVGAVKSRLNNSAQGSSLNEKVEVSEALA